MPFCADQEGNIIWRPWSVVRGMQARKTFVRVLTKKEAESRGLYAANRGSPLHMTVKPPAEQPRDDRGREKNRQ